MLTIVFGAGASYDSSPTTSPESFDNLSRLVNNRPPLANQLFDQRPVFLQIASNYHQITAIATELRSRISSNENLESVLAEMQSEAPIYQERHKQLMAIRHYLKDLIHNVTGAWYNDNSRTTTYSHFVSRIDKWSQTSHKCVNYITFNPSVPTSTETVCADKLIN
jgi:ABC-type transporter Mla subunit MlaD